MNQDIKDTIKKYLPLEVADKLIERLIISDNLKIRELIFLQSNLFKCEVELEKYKHLYFICANPKSRWVVYYKEYSDNEYIDKQKEFIFQEEAEEFLENKKAYNERFYPFWDADDISYMLTDKEKYDAEVNRRKELEKIMPIIKEIKLD